MAELAIDKLRFFIRDEADRQRSSIWFAHHRGNDVYVGERQMERQMGSDTILKSINRV